VTTYYIASVELYEVKAFDGTVLKKDGEIAWLGESNGYAAIGSKGDAKHFSIPIDEKIAAAWAGMPWYCQPKPGTLKNFKVTEVKTYSRTEEPV
jgi:hypothetical protein